MTSTEHDHSHAARHAEILRRSYEIKARSKASDHVYRNGKSRFSRTRTIVNTKMVQPSAALNRALTLSRRANKHVRLYNKQKGQKKTLSKSIMAQDVLRDSFDVFQDAKSAETQKSLETIGQTPTKRVDSSIRALVGSLTIENDAFVSPLKAAARKEDTDMNCIDDENDDMDDEGFFISAPGQRRGIKRGKRIKRAAQIKIDPTSSADFVDSSVTSQRKGPTPHFAKATVPKPGIGRWEKGIAVGSGLPIAVFNPNPNSSSQSQSSSSNTHQNRRQSFMP